MFKFDASQNVPLTQWEDGTIRVTGSRVPLDAILYQFKYQFKLGATAERIQDSFPSLTLREIYGAIFYCLQNTEAVEEYPSQQDEATKEGERFIEQHFDTKALRERILERRAAHQNSLIRPTMSLLLDENFNYHILRGLRLRAPNLDYIIAQKTELKCDYSKASLTATILTFSI